MRLTAGAAGGVAPVRAVDGQPGTVRVRVDVSHRYSTFEINRSEDPGTGEDGRRAGARVDGGEIAMRARHRGAPGARGTVHDEWS